MVACAASSAATSTANIVVYTAENAASTIGHAASNAAKEIVHTPRAVADLADSAAKGAAGASNALVVGAASTAYEACDLLTKMGRECMTVTICISGRLINVPKEMIFLGKNTSEEIRAKIVGASRDVVQVVYSSSAAVTQTAEITCSTTQEAMAWTSKQASVTYEKTLNGSMYLVKTAGDTCTYTYEVIEDKTKSATRIVKKKLDPNGKVIETIEELVPLAVGSGTAAAVGFAIAVGLSGPTFGASLGIAVLAALAASSAGYIATKGTSMVINGSHRSDKQDLESAQTAAGYGESTARQASIAKYRMPEAKHYNI